jgi:hypothetical protein
MTRLAVYVPLYAELRTDAPALTPLSTPAIDTARHPAMLEYIWHTTPQQMN